MNAKRPIRSVRARFTCIAKKVVLVGCTIPGLTQPATYYVSTAGLDRNPGTPQAPWRTIKKAVNTMVGGDTTIVLAGKYNEIVNTVRSGTAGQRITIRASGQVVTKTFNIAHEYITIESFEMTAANEAFMMTITGSHCEILNNTIHDKGA